MARTSIANVASMRILDSNADPVSGGKYLVQQAGTTTDKTLYNALTGGSTVANPIVADSEGRIADAYFDAGQIKISVLDASDVELAVYDNLDGSGAADSSTFVTIAGSQTITGTKTFDATIQGNASTATALNNTALGSAGISNLTGLAVTADFTAETAGKAVDANNLGEGIEKNADRVLKSAYVGDADQHTSTSIIPRDGSIPEITEGAEAFTVTLDRESDSSRIRIKGVFQVGVDANVTVSVAIFQDNGTNALWANGVALSTNETDQIVCDFEIANAATGNTTFKVRFGPSASGTAYINATSGVSDLYSTAGISSLRVEEFIRRT